MVLALPASEQREKLNVRLNHKRLYCPFCESQVMVPNLFGKINDLYNRTKRHMAYQPDYKGVRIDLYAHCDECDKDLTYWIDCHNNTKLGFTADVYKAESRKKGNDKFAYRRKNNI